MTNRQSQLELITKFINFVIRTMSKENETPQICTYVCKIQEENEDNADIIKSSLQLLLGPEHEVMSLTKMRFCAPSTDDSSVLQHVIKVKTSSPTHVATKFMGNNWVREDHILFKDTSRPSLPTNISDNTKNT